MVNVIGHLPGVSGDLDNTLIVVAAQYDSPPAGVDTDRAISSPSMNVFVPGFSPIGEVTDYPLVGISRHGWEKTAHLPVDTTTFITDQNIEEAGRALTLGLMILGREQSY